MYNYWGTEQKRAFVCRYRRVARGAMGTIAPYNSESSTNNFQGNQTLDV